MLPFGSAQGKLAQHDKNFHPLINNFLKHKKTNKRWQQQNGQSTQHIPKLALK